VREARFGEVFPGVCSLKVEYLPGLGHWRQEGVANSTTFLGALLNLC